MINKKAQGLPLNAIILTLLVIVVLLVIIVFFVSEVDSTTHNDLSKDRYCQDKGHNMSIEGLVYDYCVDNLTSMVELDLEEYYIWKSLTEKGWYN